MRKLALALTALAFLAAPASAGSPPVVKVADDFFKPGKLTVKKGTKVVFKWVGSNVHNVELRRPNGSRAKSSPFKTSGKFRYRFRKTGKWRAICVVHPSTMTMRIVVRKR